MGEYSIYGSVQKSSSNHTLQHSNPRCGDCPARRELPIIELYYEPKLKMDDIIHITEEDIKRRWPEVQKEMMYEQFRDVAKIAADVALHAKESSRRRRDLQWLVRRVRKQVAILRPRPRSGSDLSLEKEPMKLPPTRKMRMCKLPSDGLPRQAYTRVPLELPEIEV